MQFVSKLMHHFTTRDTQAVLWKHTSLRPFTISKSVTTPVTRDWLVSAYLMKPNHIKPQRSGSKCSDIHTVCFKTSRRHFCSRVSLWTSGNYLHLQLNPFLNC